MNSGSHPEDKQMQICVEFYSSYTGYVYALVFIKENNNRQLHTVMVYGLIGPK